MYQKLFRLFLHMVTWRRAWQPTPVFLSGEFHGQRSLVGYSPWARKESDTIERLHFHFHFLCSTWRRQWHPFPVLLPGKSHGWRSLVGYSPWGCEESDTTERLHFHFPELEKEMATHSSVLAWRIPGMGEPGGLPSKGSHRVGHDWSDLAAVASAACSTRDRILKHNQLY